MRHQFRFFAERRGVRDWQLTADEIHHMTKVLRLKAGMQIELINGAGWLAQADLLEVGKRDLSLMILDEQFVEKPQFSFEVAIGALRSQSFEDLLPSLVELGVQRIHVLRLDQDDKSRIHEKHQQRWQRIAEGALKQCKRLWLLDISTYNSLSAYLDTLSGDPSGRWLLDPDAAQSVATQPIPESQLILAIGSESGFSPAEQESLAQNHFQPVSLGRGVLRAYTASLAAAGCVTARLGL